MDRSSGGNPEAQKRPLIFEIKGNSLDDGPGIRTVIFFKGCPLSCSWCHNPEGKSPAMEIAFDPGECIDCEACLEACAEDALEPNNPYYVNRDKCTLCFDCARVCPTGALSQVGRYMAVEELADAIEIDIPFFRTSGGGVTLSGGEPLMFMEYVSHLLQRLGEMGVHRLIETSGQFDPESFEGSILPHVEGIYFDLKIFDPQEHRKHCGIDNSRILKNFRRFLEVARERKIEILPRIPLIPGITATDENLSQLAALLKEVGAGEVALLQYNPLWIEKSRKMGQENQAALRGSMASWMKTAELRRCQDIFEGFRLL
jgi:pyruvate formate lyase activating enzyme